MFSTSNTPTQRGSFDCNRLVASILVLFSHSYALLQQSNAEPLRRLSAGRHDFGEIAVYIFFSMSGYLVTLSWQRDGNLLRFLQRRALRVFPGLAVVVVVSALLLGPVMSSLAVGSYFSHAATWTYLAKITSYPTQHHLPGVFTDNPYAFVVNGSLWSLRLEVTLYMALAALGMLGLLGRRSMALAMVVLCLFVVEAPGLHGIGISLPRSMVVEAYCLNAAMFFIGVIMAQTRLVGGVAWMALAWCVVATIVLVAPEQRGLFALSFAPAIVLTSLRVNVSFKMVGDYSYGIYLWAFPVQQCLIARDPSLTPLRLFALALPITLVLAIVSWHVIEHRALALKPKRGALRDQRAASAASA